MNRVSARFMCALLLLTSLSGCGSGLHPVEGMVVWTDGTPAKELEGGQVVFDLPEKATSARGVIQADGSFKLSTNKPDDGALPGEYKVLVLENRKYSGGEGSPLNPPKLDDRYGNPKTTTLTATIKSGMNQLKLTVERAPK